MANFTPQEIEEMLQEFFDVVGKRQYVGARYVPIFGRKGEDTIEWDSLAPYEPLTVVMHQGVSYVSKQYVPKSVEITDTNYWAETYRFNAQVEQYRQEVLQFQSQIDQIREDMESDYVPFPDSDTYPKYGLLGQVLTTLTNGATKWEDPVTVDAEIAEPLIEAWLDDHPEATTTVQDGAVTTPKIADGAVTDAKLADNAQKLQWLSSTIGYAVLPRAFESGRFNADGTITPSPSRAHTFIDNVTPNSFIWWDNTKWWLNYFYVDPVTHENIYSPNAWNESGYIALTRNASTTLCIQVRTASEENITNRMQEIDSTVIVVCNPNKSILEYQGPLTGTTIMSNNKLGFYSVGSVGLSPMADMTDKPPKFNGGFLINSPAGSSGGSMMQTLIEVPSTTLKPLILRRVGINEWLPKPQNTWVAYGDSITAGTYSIDGGSTRFDSDYTYFGRLRDYYFRDKFEVCSNCGVRGIGWIDTGNNGETLDDMLALFTGDKTTVTLVTVMLGINDYLMNNHQLGNQNSTEKDGTVSGNIRYALRWITENYTNANVVVISPLNSTTRGTADSAWSRRANLSNSGTLDGFTELIKYWCNYFGVRFIDVLSNGFLNTYNAQNYLKDGLHPTVSGHRRLAEIIDSEVW